MRTHLIDRWLVTIAAGGVAIILLLMPFHAILTVSLSQVVGHYTLLRLWKEFALVGLGAIIGWLMWTHPEVRTAILRNKLTWLIGLFLAIQLIWGLVALLVGQVNKMALGYGWISDTRFLIFFLVSWSVALLSPQLHRWWPWLILLPASIVVGFGLVQYFVWPYDFLKHLGYTAQTIFPYEDINNNRHYIRIMSTMRGANPLGVYLVAVLSMTASYLVWWWHTTRYQTVKSWALMVLAITGMAALVLTFSRGAWLGLLIEAGAWLWLVLSRARWQPTEVVVRIGLPFVLTIVIIVGALGHSAVLQNIILHTEDQSSISTTSNEGHTSALIVSANEVMHEPLGRGPGTAGPASLYNTGHPGRIAENYFIQLAQETGWFGLAVFLAILGVLARQLWLRHRDPLVFGLLAALIGISVASLFSHTWADDTLAYVWWGLAGIACALPIADTAALTPTSHKR